jgi:hypothetical protein
VTVYITHEVRGRDLSNAFLFGDLEILVPADLQAARDSDMPAINEMIADRLEGFCDEDYLLLAGDPVCIGLALAWASEYNDGCFKVLKWDRLEERYLPIQIDMWEERKEIP